MPTTHLLETDTGGASLSSSRSASRVILSSLLPRVPRDIDDVAPFARMVQGNPHATRLWQGAALRIDERQTFLGLKQYEFAKPVGTSVSLAPMRHPFDAAHQTRSLARSLGQPVVAGFGPGPRDFQAALLGAPYASPLTAMREYLEIIAGLLAGERLEYHGSYFHVAAGLPGLTSPPIELGLGVLRPGMARLAGSSGATAITWLAPPQHIRTALSPAIEDGAAGRSLPRIVAMVPYAICDDGVDPVDVLLRGSTGHLQMPHYLDMLAQCGADIITGDLRHNAGEAIRIGAVAIGNAERVLDVIGSYVDSGVSEIVLNPAAVAIAAGIETATSQVEAAFNQLGKEYQQ